MKIDRNKTVLYKENALVITIPATSPEALHELLMRGIATSLRLSLGSTDTRKEDADGLIALTELMQSLIPTERILLQQGC